MTGSGRTKQEQATRWAPALSVLLALAGGIHLAATADHLGTAPLHGAFFLTVTAAQLGLAVIVGRRPGQGPLALAAALSTVVALVWAVSRTAGLPFGAHANVAEPALLADILATSLEVAAAAVSVVLLRAAPAVRLVGSGPPAPSRRLTAGVGAAALAAMGLTLAVGPAGAHDHHGPAPAAAVAHVDTVGPVHDHGAPPPTAAVAQTDPGAVDHHADATSSPVHTHRDGAAHDHEPAPGG